MLLRTCFVSGEVNCELARLLYVSNRRSVKIFIRCGKGFAQKSIRKCTLQFAVNEVGSAETSFLFSVRVDMSRFASLIEKQVGGAA